MHTYIGGAHGIRSDALSGSRAGQSLHTPRGLRSPCVLSPDLHDTPCLLAPAHPRRLARPAAGSLPVPSHAPRPQLP
eukprot:5541183-Prymnesium_polylepis.1